MPVGHIELSRAQLAKSKGFVLKFKMQLSQPPY